MLIQEGLTFFCEENSYLFQLKQRIWNYSVFKGFLALGGNVFLVQKGDGKGKYCTFFCFLCNILYFCAR